MPDIRTQLKVLEGKISKASKAAEETAPRKRFNLGRWLDRTSLEIAVHIPVFVAVGISIYGWMQYGAFAAGLIPLTCALSWLLSRTYSMGLKTHRLDVAFFLTILGGLSFVVEAYGVHLGLERFNAYNEANHLQTFDGTILVLVSIMLGLMNLFSRRAYITGHEDPAEEAGRPEAWWKWNSRRSKWTARIGETSQAPRLAQLSDDDAVRCFERNGGWPLGYKPTATALARVS